MHGDPAVSIVMTAYNVGSYVGAAVESALNQTFPDFELIVVDDGSTDQTLEIVRKYNDPRLKLVSRPHDGLVHTLRHGVALARAPYLAFHDADDLWSPRKLERHVQFLDQHAGVDVTFSWSRIIDERGMDTGLTARLWTGPISFAELLADNVIGNGSALVFRRQALEAAGGIDPELPVCHDLDAWLRIALLRPGNICAIPEFLTYYRRRAGQLTANVARMESSFELLMTKMRKLAPDEVAKVEKTARVNMRRFFAFGWYQASDYRRSLSYMMQSLRRWPGAFVRDTRNWKMTAAAAAGLLLPAVLHGRLARTALKAKRA